MDQKPIVCTLKAPPDPHDWELSISLWMYRYGRLFPEHWDGQYRFCLVSNNYTASLTVACKIKDANGKTSWKKVLKRKILMPNPHIENKGQSKFVLTAADFKCKLDNVTLLRLVMMQPSPCWHAFGVKEVKLYPPATVEELSVTMPRWLLQSDSLRLGVDEDERKLKEEIRRAGLPDPGQLSSSLHELWRLTDKSSAGATSVTVGRFDIDGCYEINLLSYAQN